MDKLLVEALCKKLKKLEARIATLEANAKTNTELLAIGSLKFTAREYKRNIAKLKETV